MAPSTPFDLIEEARRLVRLNTVTWGSNADCAVHIGSLLRRLGLEVHYQESRVDGTLFMNVIGLLGTGKAPLLLTTHLDTVDAGDPRLWTKTGRDPWKLTVRGTTLYGLGVADTKLDLLSKLWAVGRLIGRLEKKSLKRPLILLGTFGEESGLRGAAQFCQSEFQKPAMALVGEPSNLSLVTRHKGLAVAELLLKGKGLHRPTSPEWVYEVTFHGKAAHSSSPELGTNAVQLALQFLENLKRKYGKVMVLAWEGGTGHNVIPALATLRFSVGDRPKVNFPSNARQRVKVERLKPGWYPTLPWNEVAQCVNSWQNLIAPFEKDQDRDFTPRHLTWSLTRIRSTPEGWQVTFDIRPLPNQSIQRPMKRFEAELVKRWGHPGPTWQFRLERDNPPLHTARQAPIVKQAASALRRARLPVKVVAKAGCSEAGLYAKLGIPSIVFGPGQSRGNIHQPNESISVNQLKGAIRFYEEFVKATCF